MIIRCACSSRGDYTPRRPAPDRDELAEAVRC